MAQENKEKTTGPQAAQQPAASPPESKPKETMSPKAKGEYDRFVLGKVFSNPRTIFSVPTPRVKELEKTALFVLDAKDLLAAFRMVAGQADDIAKVYRSVANDDRILVPKRAVQELARNRPTMLLRMYEELVTRKSNLGRVDTSE